MLKQAAYQFDQALAVAFEQTSAKFHKQERGRIAAIAGGVVQLTGFAAMGHEELITLANGGLALASEIASDRIGAILLGDTELLQIGDLARRTHRRVDTPVGEALLGRVVSALGAPIDGLGHIHSDTRWHVEQPVPEILDRAPVRRPLQTGIKSIDAAIPIGRGQRELILGDRQTGKTSIAVDAILNQSDDVVSVYCAIGQRKSAVARVIASLKEAGALQRTIIVVAGGDDPPGLQYLAPYAATSMAEYFMRQGRDALIVYDDLTSHARAYRELSLLLRRPPGREAYPGDIFFLHARLLERATQLREEKGGGSLTALPIIETKAQLLSAYIPTNLISITDGQILVSSDLFEKGQLPAIDVGQSVSRVGGKAQPPAYRSVTAALKLYYSQFEELEAFSRFGTRLDEKTRIQLERGRRIREVLKQKERAPLSDRQQIAVLLAAITGLLDRLSLDQIADAEALLIEAADSELPPWHSFDANRQPTEAEIALMTEELKRRLLAVFPEDAENGNA